MAIIVPKCQYLKSSRVKGISYSNQNIEDQSLKNYVGEIFKERIIEKTGNSDDSEDFANNITQVCFNTIHSLFIDHGSELSVLLRDEDS